MASEGRAQRTPLAPMRPIGEPPQELRRDVGAGEYARDIRLGGAWVTGERAKNRGLRLVLQDLDDATAPSSRQSYTLSQSQLGEPCREEPLRVPAQSRRKTQVRRELGKVAPEEMG